MNNTEKHSFNPGVKKDHEALKEECAKRHEQLREKLERAGEMSHENTETTLHEALEKATSKEKLAEKNEQNVTAKRALSCECPFFLSRRIET